MNYTLEQIKEIALQKKQNKDMNNPNRSVRVKYDGDDFIQKSIKESKQLLKLLQSKHYK